MNVDHLDLSAVCLDVPRLWWRTEKTAVEDRTEERH